MLYGGRRPASLNENEAFLGVAGVDSYLGGRNVDGALGFLRGYLTSFGARKVFASDFRYILGNPEFRRLFSSEAPKKKSKLYVYVYISIDCMHII